jgi:DNA-binding GntR family transcriptional regulator
MLVRQRGSGTVVAAPPLKRVYSQTLQSLNELDTYAANVRLQIHSQGVVVLRPALAEILGADVGSKWLRIAGVRSLVGTVEPLAWTEIFIAEPYMGGRTRLNQGAEPFFEQLSREFGLVINEVEQRISAIAIPSDLAAHLQMTANEPALLVRRRYYADAVTPFEISVSVHPADRYASVTRVLRETPGRASQRDEGPTVS